MVLLPRLLFCSAQVACGDFRMTLAPYASTCPRSQCSQSQSQANACAPAALVINNLLCLPVLSPGVPLGKDPCVASQSPALWVWIDQSGLRLETLKHPTHRPYKSTCPRHCCPLCVHSDLTSLCDPSKCARYFCQALWVIHFSISALLVICFEPRLTTPGNLCSTE